ncbi:peroxisomal NADH pyrophosphatase NUDT12 [Periophthalmus magnuspinnatus]|uniref:peroxisomal NADH pyrophosphatase NUDT12 n=1 Tax=Periophthalmus magnuspinnatus TaxID=409849 RepID=UPI00145BDE76|nr:peroxisomal NADH pyrophosphatase NUDT12 [Periophthalmus magnuspinnatus]XP_055080324.1 peroxisomal NADH pyrophosphatase NUDT12 [Periophthalmus magnuspinnatus]XP_055080325.1 peroxisomal NADH pyrophosphatase NUDT12 [Periophthalmus magnuspinnatus]XP_055080326.1 peroxisomal NADH pyrophosphatase NUDT12 [Periophthalmus magnuspinnatus]XP_055080327.1 peroxisomal NADH pyrophosphatase NUDT12 [Periophthalmus magnuspinnatus]
MSEEWSAQEELVHRFLDAASRGDVALVSSLLSNSPSLLNQTGPNGWTALMHAARNGDHNLVRALLHRGCDRSPLNSSSQTAFDIAKFWGHTHICRLLLRPDSAQEPAVARAPALDPGLASVSVSGPVSGPVSDQDLRTCGSLEQSPHEMFFSAEPLDRLSIKRPDQDWIRTRQKDPRTVYLLFHKLSPMTRGGEESGPAQIRLCRFSFEEVQDLLERPGSEVVFLGVDRTPPPSDTPRDTEPSHLEPRTWFALESDLDQEELLKRSKDKTCSFPKNPHRDLLRLSEEEAGLVAQSRSVLAWHARYSFCSTCGGRSRVEEAGHKRSCENTTCVSHQGVHNTCYPRVDPVVIMLVLHPDQNHCLLGRKKVFPPGMFSCLAGFIEPGECVEAAVRREVQEESGVLVDPVWYVCSQPWPMPSSLMIGCLTIAVTTEITVDQDEIEEAKWFSRQQVIDSLIGGSRAAFVVPPRQTIAHQLLRHWTGLTSNL